MIIAINTRVLPEDSPEEYREFIYEIINRIAGKNPDHQFLFITDKKNKDGLKSGPNVQLIAAAVASQRPLLWKFWLAVKIKSILKKYKADVFVSFDGISLSSKLPQCLIVQNLYNHETAFIKKNQQQFYKKYNLRFFEKATTVAATSELLKKKIIDQYNTAASKIDVVFGGADESFVPVSYDEKLAVKRKYTEGKEFFIYTGSIHSSKNLITLLKAFSVFKKRQQTNMKLILAGTVSKNYQSFKENLKGYKYKSDVLLLENPEQKELVKITATALAFINVSQQEGFSSSVIEALRCAVPVIIAENSSMQEIINDAALYADASNHKDIADKMMQIYKDENLQRVLVQKSKLVSEKYNWDATAELIWKSILKAAGK